MLEVIRRKKRKELADASKISLALDDRKQHYLIRFACDIGKAPPQASTELGSHHGILAAMHGLLGLTEERDDEYYAKQVVAKVKKAIQLFFTPLGSGDVNES